MILSYVVGDNPVFRVAVHIFVGVAAGYVAAVAWWQVLLPRLLMPLLGGTAQNRAILAVPFLLSGLLLMKAWPPLSRLGAPAMGLLVGVGSAVAIGGAIQGTLAPQLISAVNGMGAAQRRKSGRFDQRGFCAAWIGCQPRVLPVLRGAQEGWLSGTATADRMDCPGWGGFHRCRVGRPVCRRVFRGPHSSH